jgi:ribosomal protein S11
MKLKKAIDRNGNTIIRVQTGRGGFSIQTNGNLPFAHGCPKETLADKRAIIFEEIRAFVMAHGTRRQKSIIKS